MKVNGKLEGIVGRDEVLQGSPENIERGLILLENFCNRFQKVLDGNDDLALLPNLWKEKFDKHFSDSGMILILLKINFDY